MTTRALCQKYASAGRAGASPRVRVLPRARSALRVSGEYCLVSSIAFIVHSPCADDPANVTAPCVGGHKVIVAFTAQGAEASLAVVAALVLGKRGLLWHQRELAFLFTLCSFKAMDRLTPKALEISPTDAAARAARAERRLVFLGELAAIGMRLAREVERQALDGELAGDPGLVFSRISRAVRQTLALEARLDAEAEAQARQVSSAQKSREAARLREARKQKDRVRRYVEEAIAANDDGRDAEGLELELDERLEDPDYEDELGERPIGVIVAGICGALGVKVDLRHFTDAELDYRFTRPDFRREKDLEAAADALVPADLVGAGDNGADPAVANDTGDPPEERPPVDWAGRLGRGPPPGVGRISSG
jgi:hypothetical protein